MSPRLRSFVNKKRGGRSFASLLQWAGFVDETVIICKSGAFLTAYEYYPPDVAALSDEQREAISTFINRALMRFDGGWSVWAECCRLPANTYLPESGFENANALLFDEERRRHFESSGQHFKTRYFIVMSYLSKNVAGGEKMDDMIFGKEAGGALNESLRRFKDTCAQVVDLMSAAFGAMKVLAAEDVVVKADCPAHRHNLAEFLNYSVSGEMQPILLPPVPFYLDELLGGVDLSREGNLLRVGEELCGILSLDGLPTSTVPQLLHPLDSLGIPYRWSTRMIFMERYLAERELGKIRSSWSQRSVRLMDMLLNTQGARLNQHAVEMMSEVDEAISLSQQQAVTYAYYTSIILIRSTDGDWLKKVLRELRGEIGNWGFKARMETHNLVEAYVGSLPGNPMANVRRPLVHTLTASDLFPAHRVWAGSATSQNHLLGEDPPALAVCSAEGGTPFHLDLYVGDVGHTLIVGPTGAGKSTLLAFLAAQFLRHKNARVFCFDKGYGLYPATQAFGGTHYEIGDKGQRFAPLGDLAMGGGVADDVNVPLEWCADWIDSLCVLQDCKISADDRREIRRALDRMSNSSHCSLNDFHSECNSQGVKSAVSQYLEGLLDGEVDNFADFVGGKIHTFEVANLLSMGEKVVLPVITALFRKIERTLTGSPQLIIIDEAWAMLGHPVFRGKIADWLKTLRKHNAAVVLATQTLSNFVSSGIGDVLLESCPTRILLPNVDATTEHTKKVYNEIGVTDRECELLASARPKRQYFYMSPRGRRLFELNLRPNTFGMAVCTSGSAEDIKSIRTLKEAHGDDWVKYWGQLKGFET